MGSVFTEVNLHPSSKVGIFGEFILANRLWVASWLFSSLELIWDWPRVQLRVRFWSWWSSFRDLLLYISWWMPFLKAPHLLFHWLKCHLTPWDINLVLSVLQEYIWSHPGYSLRKVIFRSPLFLLMEFENWLLFLVILVFHLEKVVLRPQLTFWEYNKFL